VIGASGRSGAALCRALQQDGVEYVPVVRSAERWAATGLPAAARIADLEGGGLAEALRGADVVVSCAHARHVPGILAAAPAAARFVGLGSTRKFTRWPDAHGDGVLAGERALLASGRPGVLLHPTMIYGAAGEDNVQRLAALLRRLPVVPLPDGGRALVQPIHQSDITRSLQAAIGIEWRSPESIVIAGPAPVAYAEFVRLVAAAAGLRRPVIVAVRAGLLLAAARLTRLLPMPLIAPEEIRRLLENKNFATTVMQSRLGVWPIPLQAGLALTFGPS